MRGARAGVAAARHDGVDRLRIIALCDTASVVHMVAETGIEPENQERQQQQQQQQQQQPQQPPAAASSLRASASSRSSTLCCLSTLALSTPCMEAAAFTPHAVDADAIANDDRVAACVDQSVALRRQREHKATAVS